MNELKVNKLKLQNKDYRSKINSSISRNVKDREGSFIFDVTLLSKVEYRSPAFSLYLTLASIAKKSNIAVVTIEELSVLFNRTPRTTRRWIKFLKDIVEMKSTNIFIINDSYKNSMEG
jgi:hypothetical protein